jgi:hypothetical protein
MHTATMPQRHIPQPVSAPAPSGYVTRPAKARSVWVEVPTDDGREVRSKGFTHAWTNDRVRVQVLWRKEYYTAATEFWVDASRVSRRVIDPEWIGR